MGLAWKCGDYEVVVQCPFLKIALKCPADCLHQRIKLLRWCRRFRRSVHEQFDTMSQMRIVAAAKITVIAIALLSHGMSILTSWLYRNLCIFSIFFFFGAH